MDPPSYTSAYTVDDFLSEKLIAVRFSESDAYQSLCAILIEKGYDGGETLTGNLPKPGDAIVYFHHRNNWVQKGSYDALTRLGYTLIEADDLCDLIPDFNFKVEDILDLLEDA